MYDEKMTKLKVQQRGEVNQKLVLRWVTVSGLVPSAGHLFQYVTNQSPKANSAFHLSGVGK